VTPIAQRGWHFGGEEFAARTLDGIEETRGRNQAGREYAESMQQRAGRIVAKELRRTGWLRIGFGEMVGGFRRKEEWR